MSTHRLITKDGKYGVKLSKDKSFMSLGFCENLISCNWICFILMFASIFIVSWTMFALIWYVIAHIHGDLNAGEFSITYAKTSRPCVKGLESFNDALFFSIDLQSTMGYGRSEIQDECPIAVALFFIQCLAGIFVQATAVSLLFTKFSRKGETDISQNIEFPVRLKLIKMDKEIPDDALFQDLSKSCDNWSELSQPKLKKYVRNPNVFGHAKNGKLKTKNKYKATVSGSADYFLQFEFKSLKENMSLNVHGFLITKRIISDSKEVRMEICSTKTIKLFDNTIDSSAKNINKFKFQSDGCKFMHKVDRNSPLRPHLLSMMKTNSKKTSARLNPVKLKLARSLENLREEIMSNMKMPDLKLISSKKNILIDFLSNHSCDEASLDSDESSFDRERIKNKKSRRIHLKRRFHDEEINLESTIRQSFLNRKFTTESSCSSLNDRFLTTKDIVLPKPGGSTHMEMVFFVEGMETDSGVLIEAKVSYMFEDIVPDF